MCVTGVTGYVASFIVRELLSEGYSVRGTVRSLSAPSKLEPLRALDSTGCKLQLVELDMTDPSTFRSVLSGCQALIHTATPIGHFTGEWSSFASEAEAEEKQMRPAVEGTAALLRVAAEVGITRIVLTSSTSAMAFTAPPLTVLDESCWTDVETERQRITSVPSAAYRIAKTLQERTARQIADELGLKLVVINPSYVAGPSLTPHINIAQRIFIDLCMGRMQGVATIPMPVPDRFMGLVDVREVAKAHVLGLKEKEGRYMVKTAEVHYDDILRVLIDTHDKFKQTALRLDTRQGRKAKPQKFDNTKAQKLGLCCIPWEDTVRETGLAIINYGHLN